MAGGSEDVNLRHLQREEYAVSDGRMSAGVCTASGPRLPGRLSHNTPPAPDI